MNRLLNNSFFFILGFVDGLSPLFSFLALFLNSEYLELLMLMVFGDIYSVYWHLIYSSVFEVLSVQFS